jgi:hypothetical protein
MAEGRSFEPSASWTVRAAADRPISGHGADGGIAEAQDIVFGTTSGHLSLSQTAIGGNGGGGGGSSTTPAPGGSARSQLTLGTWSSQVDVLLRAIGGDGGDGSQLGADAGDARAFGDVAAYAGGVSLAVRADGGNGAATAVRWGPAIQAWRPPHGSRRRPARWATVTP